MRIVLSLLVTAALAISGPALAGNNKAKKGHDSGGAQTTTSQVVTALITVTERTIILGYVNQYPNTLVAAPGAKPLPPGIAKKIARGGTLPPGIAKRYLPQNLLTQLPPRPGYQWVVVDNDVMLIAAATGVIVDILADIL